MQIQKQTPALHAVGSVQLKVNKIETIMDILSEQIDEDLIEGLFPKIGVGVIFGDSQAGKTFLAMDIAASISTKTKFCGRDCGGGPVVYIAAEGFGGIKKRIRALNHKHVDLISSPFFPLRQAINFREDIGDLIIRIKDVRENHGDISAIFIDTLSQTLHGDENSKDMTEYVNKAIQLSQTMKCLVVIVHHEGKDAVRGPRGSSSLRGNVDVMMRVTKSSDGMRVATTNPDGGGKCKDDEPVTIGFNLGISQVGKNKAGKEVTSCFVDYVDSAIINDIVSKPSKPILKGVNEKLCFSLCCDLGKSAGVAGKLKDGIPCFPESELLDSWMASKTATGNKKQGAASYCLSAVQLLIDKGYIAKHENGDITCLK